jgi:hypothetical protein
MQKSSGTTNQNDAEKPMRNEVTQPACPLCGSLKFSGFEQVGLLDSP